MNQNTIKQFIDSFNSIPDKRNYWFIRTNSGMFYDDFVTGNYIAIGYNKVALADITNKSKSKSLEILSEKVLLQYPDETRPNYISKQLLDFVFNIKKGDIIIIPSEHSNELTIGEIQSDDVYYQKQLKNETCDYTKRKKIKWVKTISKYRLDPNLYPLIYTQRTVSQIKGNLVGFVDRILKTFYTKNNKAHFVVNIEKKDNVKAADLFKLWLNLFHMADDFGQEYGIDFRVEESIDIKINVQSPGPVELISDAIPPLVIVALIACSIVGANFETTNNLFPFKFKTNGVAKMIFDFITSYRKQDLVNDVLRQMNNLDVKKDDLTKLLNEFINKDSQKD